MMSRDTPATDTPTGADGGRIRISVTITGDGPGARVRVFEADPGATDVTELMSRIGAALPEFDTVHWETTYLSPAPES